MSTIAVVRAERPYRDLTPKRSDAGGAYTKRGEQVWKSGRVYADFIVDGIALSTRANRTGDNISCLGWGARSWQDAVVARLLLQAPPDLASGRVSLYVCPECGDLGCGAVTVRIRRIGNTVTWSDFWYEGNYEGFPSNNNLLEDLGPYSFTWAEYEPAILAGRGMGGFDDGGTSNFGELYQRLLGAGTGNLISAQLGPLLSSVYETIIKRPYDAGAVADRLEPLLEFLASPTGRTDANCRAVNDFFSLDDWTALWEDEPAALADIFGDMAGALHDTVAAPAIAANFDSTPEQLLARLKAWRRAAARPIARYDL